MTGLCQGSCSSGQNMRRRSSTMRNVSKPLASQQRHGFCAAYTREPLDHEIQIGPFEEPASKYNFGWVEQCDGSPVPFLVRGQCSIRSKRMLLSVETQRAQGRR